MDRVAADHWSTIEAQLGYACQQYLWQLDGNAITVLHHE